MNRRAFLGALGLLAAPIGAEGQAGKVPRVGYLSVTSAANGLHNLEALRAGLRTFGYVEGQSITIEARWADGRIERLPELARELVRLPVDILCTAGGQASVGPASDVHDPDRVRERRLPRSVGPRHEPPAPRRQHHGGRVHRA